MWPDELAEFLLFRGLTPKQRTRLAPLFSHVAFEKGETIFAQGDRAETVYLLEDGLVTLRFNPEDGEWLNVATIYRGGVFGWSAILGRETYTSSAICAAPTRTLAIPGEKLRALIRDEPELSILLGRMALTVTERQAGALSQVITLISEEITRTAVS